MRGESWKFRSQQQCKIRERTYKETCRKPDTRKRLEGTLCKGHADRIAGKGINSLNYYNLVHKFIPMPGGMKIPDAKAAVDKEWQNY